MRIPNIGWLDRNETLYAAAKWIIERDDLELFIEALKCEVEEQRTLKEMD